MLLGAILARENRLVLGLPGIGVSNLLRFLVAKDGLFERDVIFAYLDCDTLAGDQTPKAFFDAIAAQLHDQGLNDQSARGEQGYRRLERLIIGVEGDPSRRLAI